MLSHHDSVLSDQCLRQVLPQSPQNEKTSSLLPNLIIFFHDMTTLGEVANGFSHTKRQKQVINKKLAMTQPS